ncbi:MAG: helix-turn-helix domain-containing protein [Acidobacterium ailaaui]|nr:helix-turn-helix domain-containing protein [Pseudacidobacterium ailaaui]
MNVSQLHEQLRRELLRRIQRGTLTGTLLARQTGLNPAHISNFLHGKRQLSLAALDRVLAAQDLHIENFVHRTPVREPAASLDRVPLVAQATAIHQSRIHSSSILELIQLPSGFLHHLVSRRSPDRRSWDRFLAIRVEYSQARPMMPVIFPHAILVLDRHYTSLTPWRPPLPNIYAVHSGAGVLIRYVSLQGSHLVLRPAKLEYSVELLELRPKELPSKFIIGRVCAVLGQM